VPGLQENYDEVNQRPIYAAVGQNKGRHCD
jgi:hypothetical protein